MARHTTQENKCLQSNAQVAGDAGAASQYYASVQVHDARSTNPLHTDGTTTSTIYPAQSHSRIVPDILMEILSVAWLADVSPQERRHLLVSIPRVCKAWLEAFSYIYEMHSYAVCYSYNHFYNQHALRPKSLLLDDSSKNIIMRSFTCQLPAPPTSMNHHSEISCHIAKAYTDTGTAAGRGPNPPARLLRHAIDTFRELEYQPNLCTLILEYRTHIDTDPCPIHRFAFRVVHVDVEYHIPPDEPHWKMEELGVLPGSPSRAQKRDMLPPTVPDLDLVSFAPGADLQGSISDFLDMSRGSFTAGDDMQYLPTELSSMGDAAPREVQHVAIQVHSGLQGMYNRRFALVHGALDAESCVVIPRAPPPPQVPTQGIHVGTSSVLNVTHLALPPVPQSVKGRAIGLVVELGRGEANSEDVTNRNHLDNNWRVAQILSKKSTA